MLKSKYVLKIEIWFLIVKLCGVPLMLHHISINGSYTTCKSLKDVFNELMTHE